MKKKIALILAVSLMLSTAGCKEASDAPVAREKNQEMMIETALSGKVGSSRLSSLEVPERLTGDWSDMDSCVVVHADAEITTPGMDSIPTARVERQRFSQADADKLMDVFLGESVLRQEQGVTKQRAQERLDYYLAVQRGEISEHEEIMGNLSAIIDYYAERAINAPEPGEAAPASTAFQSDSAGNETIEGFAELKSGIMHVSISNNSFSGERALFYMEGYGDAQGCSRVYADNMQESVDMAMTEAEALEMGNALMEKLGKGNFVCDQIEAVAYRQYDFGMGHEYFDSGYEMEFVRTVNGFPLAHCPQYQIEADGRALLVPAITGTSSQNIMEDNSWAYERVTVWVNRDGVVYFFWLNPYSEPEIQTTDTQLMSFSDIADIFAKMIIVKNSEQKAINAENGFVIIRDVDIDNVRLSLMRVRSKDNFDEALIVPVWDFWGTVSTEVEDEAYQNLVSPSKVYSVMLTVNAIDGTIVDRNFGY